MKSTLEKGANCFPSFRGEVIEFFSFLPSGREEGDDDRTHEKKEERTKGKETPLGRKRERKKTHFTAQESNLTGSNFTQ